MTERRETSGLTTRLIVEFVRRESGDAAVREMLRLAGETRPVALLENEGVWSTYDQKIALFAGAAAATGRDDVARAIGETVLDSTVGTTLRVALGLLGSPASLLRVITRAGAKFSTAAEMRATAVTRTTGVVHYRLLEGFTPSRLDCEYTLGLLTQVPAVFGLPAATVVHDECQVDGAEECVYRLRWHRRTRLPWRRPREGVVAEALLARLHQLQATLGDLVATTQVDEVLDAIAARASSAVNAQRFLLAAKLEEDGPVHARYDGFEPASADDFAAALVEGRPLELPDQHILVVDVATTVRSYGRLAAVADYPFLEHEHELLQAYARLAGTALDAVTALATAEDRRRTAEALLGLAGRLHGAHSREDISAVVADAARTVVDADVASMMLLDGTETLLRVVGHSGWPADLAPLLAHVEVRPEDTQELVDLLANPHQPRVYDDGCADEYLRMMLQAFRTRQIALVPIHGSGRTYGVLIAGWAVGTQVPAVTDALIAKLAGLADQAMNALEKAELVDKVHMQATTDALTGVANRRLLTEQLRETVASASADTPPALLFIDLDRFKLVNDTLGHAAGDELLKVVAERLQDCVRTDDLVARLGGDEFTVLLRSVTGPEAALEFAQQVQKVLVEPIVIRGRVLHVRGSIGIVVVSPDSGTAGSILRDADAAMYAAKKSGGDRCVLFDAERFGSDCDALDLESDLYTAVHDRQLSVAYQPQVDLTTGEVIGVECLVRWEHPTRGSLPPDRFLPLAEASGLILPLDLWVLETACLQGAHWHRSGRPWRVAINVSARTLTQPEFVPAVVEALAVSGLTPGALEIELTEATAIAEVDRVRAVLAALRELGVSVAVDDLGTGYSSLLWVSSFPIDRIKIDRSFVADLDVNGPGAPLVEALIGIGQRLGHHVLAEGVETETQAQRLRDLGCREAQGYAFGRPGTAEAVERLAAVMPKPRAPKGAAERAAAS